MNLTGDTFRLMDTNNRLIASKKQIERWGIKLNRLAQIYDANQNVTGYIGEQVIQNLFTPGYTFHFYDKNKTEIAVAKQDIFNLLDVFTIKDTQGNLLYTIKQQFNLFGNTYELMLHQTSVVPVEQAIFLTCILDAIKTSPSQSMAYQHSFQATTYRPSHFTRNYLFYSMLNNWTTKRPNDSSFQTTNVNKDKTSSSTNSTAPVLDLNKDKNTTNTQAENSKNNSTSNKQTSSSTNKNSINNQTESSTNNSTSNTQTNSSSNKNSNFSTNKSSSSSSTNKNSNSSSSSSKKSPNKSNTIKKPSSRQTTRR